MPKGQSYVVLENLNLSITQGEFISIIGHSGCGKSTLLSMIAGLNSITGGSILLNGAPIKGPGPDRGVIFQSPSLLPWMSGDRDARGSLNLPQPPSTFSTSLNLPVKKFLIQLSINNFYLGLIIFEIQKTKP